MLSLKFIIPGVGIIASSIFALNLNKSIPKKLIEKETEKNNNQNKQDIDKNTPAEIKDNNSPKEVIDNLQSNRTYHYLFVNVDSIENQSLLFDEEVKNYKCSFVSMNDQENFDETCKLFDLNKQKDQKRIDFYNINLQLKELLVVQPPENNKNYVLKIDAEKYAQIKQNNKKIKILGKSKCLITLSEKYKLTDDNFKFKTNIVLARITNTPTLTLANDNQTYKCRLYANQDLQVCKVFSFSQKQDPLTSSFFDLTKLEKFTTSNSDKRQQNDYVLIEFTENAGYYEEKILRYYDPEIFLSSDVQNIFLKTSFFSGYFGKITNNLKENELFEIVSSPLDFFIVSKSQDKTSTNELFLDLNKNYQCDFLIGERNIADEKCQLTEISDLQIEDSDIPLQKNEDFKNDKYYKLIIFNQELIGQNFDKNTEITLKSTIKSDESNSFGKIKIYGRYWNSEYTGNTNWFLAKVKDEKTISSDQTSFKCKYDLDKSYSECDIYTTANHVTVDNNATQIAGFKVNSEIIRTWYKNKLVIIDLKNNKKPINNFDGKTISITSQTESIEDNDVIQFDIVYPMYVNKTNNAVDSSSLVIN